MITKIKYKARNPKPRAQAHWSKICNDSAYSVLYCRVLKSKVSVNTSYEAFNEAVVEAGLESCVFIQNKCKGWFTDYCEKLGSMIGEKDALHSK